MIRRWLSEIMFWVPNNCVISDVILDIILIIYMGEFNQLYETNRLYLFSMIYVIGSELMNSVEFKRNMFLCE